MTEALFVSTAPVFQIDGQTKGELARDLLRLEVAESTSGLKRLTALLVGWGPVAGLEQEGHLYLDGTTIDFGKSVEVSIGADSGARTVFSGFISGIEACFAESEAPEVIVFAEDKFMDLRMTRRFRTYENMSDAEVAEALAQEHGLAAEVDADGPTYDVLQQWNVSDLAFLRERGRHIQAEVWFQDDALHFKTRDKRTATEITLVQGNQLIELQARADLAHQRTRVVVSGYGAGDRAGFEDEAGAEAIQAEISGGRTGPAVLEQAFGERASFRAREVPLASGEATDWARAEMLRRCRGFVTLAGATNGTPDMVVGSRLTLERAGTPFDGSGYYVTSVSHTYDLMNGHRTRFTAERATIQEA